MKNPDRITLLADHKAITPDLATEHSLSFILELGERVILFDTGASDVSLRNAERLGLPMEKVGHVVLSHGHRDHTGGLGHTLERLSRAQVYLHPRALGPKYSRHPGRPVREIGFPRESWGAICPVMHSHVNWTTAPLRLAPGIGITGPVPRRHPEEAVSGPFFLDTDGCRPDPLEDDQALWFRVPQGLVVVLGCAHAGVVNTLEYVLQVTGERHIHAVMGGLHLVQASDERMTFTAEALESLGVERILPCHCTGDAGTAFLANRLGDRVHQLAAGESIAFGGPARTLLSLE